VALPLTLMDHVRGSCSYKTGSMNGTKKRTRTLANKHEYY